MISLYYSTDSVLNISNSHQKLIYFSQLKEFQHSWTKIQISYKLMTVITLVWAWLLHHTKSQNWT